MNGHEHLCQMPVIGGRETVDEEEFIPILEIRTQTDESFQEQEEQDQEEECQTVPAPATEKGEGKKKQAIELPVPPDFEPLIQGYRRANVNLDGIFDGVVPPPITLFRFFFTDKTLETIVTNTNLYAENKQAESSGRAWKNITMNELVTWIAITIYIGLYQLSSYVAIWNTNREAPTHHISRYMYQVRYEQIKRYIHVCAPDAVIEEYCDKLEPLLSQIRVASKRYYIPASNVSVDEMTIRFSGRGAHTVRMKNKPTPEGFKIFSLCDAGYTYAFVPTSRMTPARVEKIPGLTQTGSTVNHLVQQLPKASHYRVFMDNYFTSVNLFQHLRNQNIGACGTARKQGGVPKELQVEKGTKLDWDTRSGVVVGGVLVVFWQDNGPVTMMTTIHEIAGAEWEVLRERPRPRETSTNGAKVRAIFGNSPRKEIKILKVIDDYNYNMGGIDIADQLRSYYSTQQTTRRNWMPIFFWLLDTTIINTYLIARKKGSLLTHKEFRSSLIWGLIDSVHTSSKARRHNAVEKEDENEDDTVWKRPRVTKNFELPNDRFTDDNHFPVTRKHRGTCMLCSWKYQTKQIYMSQKNPFQSNIWCQVCKVPLCSNGARPCFKEYHTQSTDLE